MNDASNRLFGFDIGLRNQTGITFVAHLHAAFKVVQDNFRSGFGGGKRRPQMVVDRDVELCWDCKTFSQ